MEENIYTIERSEAWRDALRKSKKASERTKIERVVMPAQQPDVRNKNNAEVNSGLTVEQAVKEASRCLDCANPTCVTGCPVGVHIPSFVKCIEARDFLGAAKVLKKTNALPSVCGRVCPQEVQCESKCFYVQKMNLPAVAIGNLERFAADFERESGKAQLPEKAASNGIKVGVVGSGPSGLAAAGDLIKNGYDVTVFEALHEIGGVLKYGIPEFRLPNNVVEAEINTLRQLGVKFETDFLVGKTATLDDLREEGFKAFYVSSGAGLPNFMNMPGENLIGVFSSNEYLTRVNLMGAASDENDTPILRGKTVMVVGGGNTAMDSVRTAKRMGAEKAMIVYRRSMDEMPARKEEIHHAMEEGIEFNCLLNPVECLGDEKGHVRQVKVQKMELGEPDASGRRRPQPIEGSEYLVDVDLVIISIGVSPNPLIPKTVSGLEVTRKGTIVVDAETMQSNIPDLFAGGDIVRGGATVILAMGDGRRGAAGIMQYLSSRQG